MICDSCKVDRLIRDFLNNQKFCFHCMYRIKVEKAKTKQTGKTLRCRTCGNDFSREETMESRQRTVFCSGECAEKGHKKQLDEYWTRKIRSDFSSSAKKAGHIWNSDRKSIPQEKRRGKYTAMRRLPVKKES